MACTTILVGKAASYDGSTIVARNEDSPNGQFEPKRLEVVLSQDQPRTYTSVESHLCFELPDNPVSYSSVPDALPGHGIWASAGFNEHNVGMSATETITTNERVLGADPLVVYQPAQGKPEDANYVPEVPGGLGEEDFVSIVLPYVNSARSAVLRLGSLLEQYGTYESNAIAFSDSNEIWWLETIGGHHWIARRVPDDAYVTMPNQLGIDSFNLNDAEGAQLEHMASADLRSWMELHHLNLALNGDESVFNPRISFGSKSPSDHIYNTPRAWYMQRTLNPSDAWDGADARYTPESDDIPWCRVPEQKVTIEDIKFVLSSHFQDTPYDCYGWKGTRETRSAYRPIGINRNSQLAVLQMRSGDEPGAAVQWMAFGSNIFNALVPLYAQVSCFPDYFTNTSARVSTESFYWANRLIAALADRHYGDCIQKIEAYQQTLTAFGHQCIARYDQLLAGLPRVQAQPLMEEANQLIAEKLKEETDKLLSTVLYIASCKMMCGFSMSDNERSE
ncbi:C69 family dipeptidase [Collinsella sp. zg1085]|uniref:C69 family dipeptidase n=1 Tax=Collinsella sp. zg1085 TaxID=2844380 RepID=UPI001C0B7797|nr:C69 family dipeptidase [Collinsella sp. zg1085]QWT17258.1 C69 family dipeptidase [Collinsella sp. zg1085]